MKNDRKVILLQYSSQKIEDSYEIAIMQDAIDSGEVLLAASPDEYRDMEYIIKHNRRLEEGLGDDEELFHMYMYGVELQEYEKYIIMVNDYHYCMRNRFFFKWLRKFDVKIVLLLRNMIANKDKPKVGVFEIDKIYDYFDLVVTDEPSDAEKFGFPYIPDSFADLGIKNSDIKTDLFFCGMDKGRAGMVYQIFLAAQKQGVKCDFRFVQEGKHCLPGITYIEKMPYKDIIRNDLFANCILEVLQVGQDGYSLRQEEAVCLGRKLLTNNPRVKESKFYNSKYVQYFTRVEDIDFGFVKKREMVNYNYQGEYSGITFVKKIKELLEEAK